MVASGRSQADAYRVAYPKSQKWKPEALYAEVSKLAANTKVSTRIAVLRAEIQEQVIADSGKKAIDSTASDLANSPKVSRRLADLRAEIQEEAGRPIRRGERDGGEH